LEVDPKKRSRQELLKRSVVIIVAVIIGFLIGIYLLNAVL
jgi:preprotein translocase subunit SecE